MRRAENYFFTPDFLPEPMKKSAAFWLVVFLFCSKKGIRTGSQQKNPAKWGFYLVILTLNLSKAILPQSSVTVSLNV